MVAKSKFSSSQHSKRWATTENSSWSRRSPSMASAGKELNQSGSSPYPCHSVPRKTLTHNTSPLMSLTCSTPIMPSLKEASSILSKLPCTQAISASRFWPPSELYPLLVVSKMPGISRRASHPATKMCIFCEKSQSNISLQHVCIGTETCQESHRS
jgi:hypothetical protein